jgi:hypothetical protein
MIGDNEGKTVVSGIAYTERGRGRGRGIKKEAEAEAE